MCGIVGHISDGRRITENELLRMRDSLTHRGPDDAGVWRSKDNKVWLGSRRLAILDLSLAGHMPMTDESGSLTIVFNGEIYNYVELATELREKGFHFRSSGDTEVLLAAYRAWGTDCLTHLNGMFAFAIWDENQRQLFAARDRFGEKPFYYVHDEGNQSFFFASEIKAFFASDLVRPSPNQDAIYHYLVHHQIDGTAATLFENVLALPAAHALLYSLSPSGTPPRTWRYWDLDPQYQTKLANDQDYATRFMDLLKDSVRLRMRSDVPVGTSLSGGLDSSTLVCLISRFLKQGRQATFSARFEDKKFDEGPFIEIVATAAQTESHQIYPDPVRFLEEAELITWHQDHPFYSSSIFAQWNVMRLAAQNGVTVMLDGQGGDESLAGYSSYTAPYLQDFARQGRWGALAFNTYKYARAEERSLPSLVLSLLPRNFQRGIKNGLRPTGIRNDFAERWASSPQAPPLKYKSHLHNALYDSITFSMLPALLRYADRDSMAFSREVRLPFLDHRLVEYLYALPADQKIRGTVTKVVMRNAIHDLVPEAIRNRRDKIGFEPPEVAWLRGPLRPRLDEMFKSSAFAGREWFDVEDVWTVWQQFLSGRSFLRGVIWRWFSLELWARVFLDGGSRRFVEKACAQSRILS